VIGGGKPTTGATKTGAGTGANAVTAHYAGYEAAVYAAASNYLQNKNQARTGGSNWKGGRGNFYMKVLFNFLSFRWSVWRKETLWTWSSKS